MQLFVRCEFYAVTPEMAVVSCYLRRNHQLHFIILAVSKISTNVRQVQDFVCFSLKPPGSGLLWMDNIIRLQQIHSCLVAYIWIFWVRSYNLLRWYLHSGLYQPIWRPRQSLDGFWKTCYIKMLICNTLIAINNEWVMHRSGFNKTCVTWIFEKIPAIWAIWLN